VTQKTGRGQGRLGAQFPELVTHRNWNYPRNSTLKNEIGDKVRDPTPTKRLRTGSAGRAEAITLGQKGPASTQERKNLNSFVVTGFWCDPTG